MTRNAAYAAMLPGYPDQRIIDGISAAKNVAKRAGEPKRCLSGKRAFHFYETYGLPVDLIMEIAAERRFAVDVFALNVHLAFPLWKDCWCCDG